jgi:hypothetical protein
MNQRCDIIYLYNSLVPLLMLKGERREQLRRSAVVLRKNGYSYPMIEKELKVARATLSGWFKDLKLSKAANNIILNRKKKNLIKIREKALLVLRDIAERRREKVYKEVTQDYVDYRFDMRVKELLLAMLYLGEGFKKTRSHIGLGNSNYKIVALFVNYLRSIYNVKNAKLRCYLHLRMDQNPEIEADYWSNKVGIPRIYFRKPQFDRRSVSKTWADYHGVCSVYCYDAKIEKRLAALQQILLDKNLGG